MRLWPYMCIVPHVMSRDCDQTRVLCYVLCHVTMTRHTYCDRTLRATVHGDHYITGIVPVTRIDWSFMLINSDCYVTTIVDYDSPITICVMICPFWFRHANYENANYCNHCINIRVNDSIFVISLALVSLIEPCGFWRIIIFISF